MTKTIYKPWGKEVWLELNDKYCYKRIYINAGNKTSYQYHHHKLETNYLIEGTAEVWLENDDGVVDKKMMNPGDFFTIEPPKKHRVIAITDIILQEVSTPEVNDVVRIEDDSNRSDGKIEHEHSRPALCILTAGLGKRMGGIAKHINKGLLPLDNKALISHLIDKTSHDYEIVIALGYKGDMVKEYCEAAHPDRDFIFVKVDKYEGDGTGPGYSISQCKQHLQRPFIWASSDTIIKNEFPPLYNDWLGACLTDIPEIYATIQIQNEKIISFKNKDPHGHEHAFIGIAGVLNYKVFWEELKAEKGGIESAYYKIDAYKNIRPQYFDWYDAGSIDNYLKATHSSQNYCLPKTNGEFLYKVNDNFIKLCSDESFISGRISRAKILTGLCPSVHYSGRHLYGYKWVDGKNLYEYDKPEIWNKFLAFAKEYLWKPVDTSPSFQNTCKKFYYEKTHHRLDQFLASRGSFFGEKHLVNGIETPPIKSLLDSLDMVSLYDGMPTKLFHGDLHFDNVVYGTDHKFHLLDWRQDFGGTEVGDVYYDLAKMYGGILISFELMKDNNNFTCDVSSTVNFKHKSTVALDQFISTYEKWVVSNNFDLKKVKALTCLMFVNIAPLHEKILGDLLFFKSKLMLTNELS